MLLTCKSEHSLLVQVVLVVKKLPANAGAARDRVWSPGLEDPLEEEIATHSSFLWRRKWRPTPVFLPGEFHGQRSLADYSSWDRKSQTQLGTIFLSFFPVFFPGISHGQRSLVGYSPRDRKESETTEWLIHTHTENTLYFSDYPATHLTR